MNNKFMGIVTLIFVLMLGSIGGLDAQDYSKGRKKKRKKEKVEKPAREKKDFVLRDRLWFGINIGSPFVTNNYFGMGLGPTVGYKFNNIFSAGLITNVKYNYLWNIQFSGVNASATDYSVGAFGRAKLFASIFVHAEYSYLSIQDITGLFPLTKRRTNFPVGFVGAGYSSGNSIWAYETVLLYDVTGNLSQFQIPIEYRIGITYNF